MHEKLNFKLTAKTIDPATLEKFKKAAEDLKKQGKPPAVRFLPIMKSMYRALFAPWAP